MKKIKTEEAIGHVLCHDITQIIKGVSKGPVFRKGHIIREEDIPVLLSVGKEHVYIWECDDSTLHENDAAAILRDISLGVNMHATEAKEGKIELVADCDGLLTIRRQGVQAVNSLGEMMIASRHGGFAVKQDDVLAGMRVIPLVISKAKMEAAKEAAGTEPLFNVLPFTAKTAGVVTTGSEVFKGRIADTFTPVIEDKLAEYGIAVTQHVTLADDPAAITAAIQDMLAQGVDMVFCTGGMSVDPDDQTPLAIKNTGARIVSYGAPVLPGAMFLLAYTDDGHPVAGLPGCVMYSKRTIFDLVLPSLAAGLEINADELTRLGEGGLCLNCPVCTFPNCGFGK
ncbi:molybdopterin-binding protein [Megasphaera stantonii]|mgnify:FL=1|uniref:molybdopterin-binding protein n=1 Tax=Megasphaera stantonii TaxID=2144175 RepID=UPI002942DBBC|nr:molybdopterin-binding protein [Megasphaera stantonii]